MLEAEKLRWENTLRCELESLHETFEAGELAYLTLTSKAEHAIRDRLAFRLQKRLLKQGFVVAREWSTRVDLAVLTPNGEPQCLLELKFNLSCDILNKALRREVIAKLEADRKKLQKANAEHPECICFQLLLLMRPTSPPTEQQDAHLKYGRILRQSHVESSKELENLVKDKHRLERMGQWPHPDSAFGIEVNMHYWLFKPTWIGLALGTND